jgi:hypothetical protein
MPSDGFELTIPAVERLQMYALDFMAIGIGKFPEYISLSTVALGGSGTRTNKYFPLTQDKRVKTI